MKNGILYVVLAAFPVAFLLNAAIYSMAHAQGAGVDPSLVIVLAAYEFNPMAWDWPQIISIAVTILGGIIFILRPVAALTSWTGDNKLLAWLEWILAKIVQLFLPREMRTSLDKLTGSADAGYQRGGKNGDPQ